jgi:hypothetical protein
MKSEKVMKSEIRNFLHSHSYRLLGSGLFLWLAVICLALSLGVTTAHYIVEIKPGESGAMTFQYEESWGLYLYNPEPDADGNFLPLEDGQWTEVRTTEEIKESENSEELQKIENSENSESSESSESSEKSEETLPVRCLSFLLTNGSGEDTHCTYSQRGLVFVIVTGAGGGDLQMTLTVGGQTHEAKGEQIQDGTYLKTQYGEGYVYRFYDGTGEELSWVLSGSSLVQLPMELTVTGQVENSMALRLTTDSRPISQ